MKEEVELEEEFKKGDRIRHKDGTLGTVTREPDEQGIVSWKHAGNNHRVSHKSALKSAAGEKFRWRQSDVLDKLKKHNETKKKLASFPGSDKIKTTKSTVITSQGKFVNGKKVEEEIEQIDELSKMTHARYQDKARADVSANVKHIHGEYGDIAKNIVDRRIKGLSTSSALQLRDKMNKVKTEEVEIWEEQHKEISVHTEVEDGSHDDKRDTKDLHDRIKAAAKKHGATVTYQDRPSLRGSHTISARGPHEFHKEVKHIASDYEHLGAQHEIDESVEQIDELSNDTLKSYLQKSKDQEGTGLGRQGAGAKHQYSYENSQNGKRNAINRLDARQGKIGKYGVVPKVPGYNKEEVEQIEEIYSVKHDGVDANHPDKDVARLFTNKKNVINHVTKFKDSAENRVKLLKDKGFKNVRMEETEQIDELSNATLRGYADKARADIQKTLPKLHTDPKATGRVEKRISGLAASSVAKVKNNMKSEEVENCDTPAKKSLMKRSDKPTAYVHEGRMKDIVTNKQEDERLAKQKGSWKVETPWKKVKSDVVVDKSGAKHTPMSRARDLARKAFSKVHEQSNVQPNPFTVPSSNPGQAPKEKKSRQMGIVREAYKDAKKKKETSTGTADKFIQDPELTSKITKS